MLFLTSITAMKRPVLLAVGCGAFGGGRAHTADWNSHWGRDGEGSTGFKITRLPAHDNELWMCFYLDRFLQHRHSASRPRLSLLVVCFPSFLSALSLLQSPGGAAAEDLNGTHRPLLAEHSRRIPKREQGRAEMNDRETDRAEAAAAAPAGTTAVKQCCGPHWTGSLRLSSHARPPSPKI